jgi:hypothetical protein
VDSYPGSQVAEAATKEKAAIAGMKNVIEEEAAAPADGKSGEAKPQESEAAKGDESKPKA